MVYNTQNHCGSVPKFFILETTTFATEGVAWSTQRILTAVFSISYTGHSSSSSSSSSMSTKFYHLALMTFKLLNCYYLTENGILRKADQRPLI
jgi:hypothetical protein